MDNQHLRVSDAEREAVVEQLRAHTAEGRLSLEEFGDRTAEALGAVTRSDLDRVLRDLPTDPPAPTAAPADPPGPRRARRPVRWGTMARVAVLVGIVSLVITTPLWWVVFPLFFWSGGFGLFGGCGSKGRTARGQGWGACGSGAWGATSDRWTHGRWGDRPGRARTPDGDHDDAEDATFV